MPQHSKKYVMPHTAEQLFDLVADVAKYPEFLPWCIAARITKNDGKIMLADLIVGYKVFREKFTSKVTMNRPGEIEVTYLNGPMKYLHNRWGFEAKEDGTCTVDFHIDFEFQNRMFESMMGAFFSEALQRMVHAFEERADDLYGSEKHLHQL